MGLSTLLLDSPIFISRPSLTPSDKKLPLRQADKQTSGQADANLKTSVCRFVRSSVRRSFIVATATSFYICRSKAKIAEIRYLRKQTEAVKEKDY